MKEINLDDADENDGTCLYNSTSTATMDQTVLYRSKSDVLPQGRKEANKTNSPSGETADDDSDDDGCQTMVINRSVSELRSRPTSGERKGQTPAPRKPAEQKKDTDQKKKQEQQPQQLLNQICYYGKIILDVLSAQYSFIQKRVTKREQLFFVAGIIFTLFVQFIFRKIFSF